MKTQLIIMVLLVVCILFTGCTGKRGWRFEIGVSPVSELNNQAGLKQLESEEEK